MKKNLLSLLFVLQGVVALAQIHFEKGYYIANDDHRVEGLIKNIDWDVNPKSFLFKATDAADAVTIDLEEAKAFVVENGAAYFRHTVQVDRSEIRVSDLSFTRAPEFSEEQIFLKKLVDGEADLYSFKDGNLLLFFYQLDSGKVEPLVSKSYRVGNSIAINEMYKQQLLNSIHCPTVSKADILKIEYEQRSLVKHFIAYNECKGAHIVDHTNSITKRKFFSLSIRPGFRSSSLTFYPTNPVYGKREIKLDDQLSFQLGIETEFSLPFNKNKWSIVIEPTFQYFKQAAAYGKPEVDYKSLNLPVSIRHYFFLTGKSTLFLNAGFLLDFPFGSRVEHSKVYSWNVSSGTGWVVGAGYAYQKRYALELRYYPSRGLLARDAWGSNYKGVAVILGYKLVKGDQRKI